jgi:hypothetical protein
MNVILSGVAASQKCHPERSSGFAKRSSYVVEGPLHARHSQRSIKAFSPRLGQRNGSPPKKARVETGLAPSQTAEQLALALDFGWRSASALRKDLPLSRVTAPIEPR